MYLNAKFKSLTNYNSTNPKHLIKMDFLSLGKVSILSCMYCIYLNNSKKKKFVYNVYDHHQNDSSAREQVSLAALLGTDAT